MGMKLTRTKKREDEFVINFDQYEKFIIDKKKIHNAQFKTT